MKKKIKVFALLTVLLCVFAVSALAYTYNGVQLWEDGPLYNSAPLEDPYMPSIPLLLKKVVKDNTTGEVNSYGLDDNVYAGEHRALGNNGGLGLDPDWRIPTFDEMAALFNNTIVTMDQGKFCFTSKTDSNIKLYLPVTGATDIYYNNEPYYENDGFFATTGDFIHLMPPANATTTPTYAPFEQEFYGAAVIVVKDPTHDHNYTLSSSGDTITATCAGCPKPNEAELTLTISGDAEKEYSGHPVTPVTMTLAGNTSTWKDLTGEDLPQIAYYNGDTLLTEAPTDVGTYTAKISVGSVTASKAFKIKPKSVAISVNPTITPNNATYTGEPITFTVTATEHGEDLVPGKDFEIMGWRSHPDTYTATTLKVTDVTDGAYITFKGIGNYEDSFMLNYAVVRKPISESPVTVTVTPEKATYTGSPIEFTVTAKNGDKDLKAGTDFKIRSFKSDASPDKISGTDVAGYFITVEGLGNYSGSVDLIGNIVPKPITVTPYNQTIVKGDPLPTLTWTSGDKDLDDELKNTLWFYTTAPHDDNDISTTAGKDFKILIEEQYVGFNYKVTYGEGNLTVLDIFTVTFDTNGGSDIPSQDVVEGKTATEPSDPTKSGMTFSGWFTDADCTKAYDFSTPVTAATTLYAGWLNDSVKVTFESNGGSAVTPQTVEYNKTATKPADPTRTGMTFTGWFTDADCTKAYDFSTAVTANTTLYAGWAAVPVTVTFESNGGSAVDPQTFDYGKTATKPADPTRTGMTFTGWFTDADCTKAYDFSTPVTTNTTLYAGWLAASPTPTPTPTSAPTPTPSPTPTPTPTSEPDPIIIEGQNGEWSKDMQYSLKFRSDADYELFIRIEVDDKTVDPTNYTSAEGSTIIFLKPSFLQSLAGGKHKLAIVSSYKSGEKKAITSFTIKVPPLPPTGDSTPIALLTLLCLVSLGTVGLILKKKKHN